MCLDCIFYEMMHPSGRREWVGQGAVETQRIRGLENLHIEIFSVSVVKVEVNTRLHSIQGV